MNQQLQSKHRLPSNMMPEIEKQKRAIESAEKKIRAVPEVVRLNKIIARAKMKISILKDTCPHTNHEAVYDGDTGGYDGPNFDTYWVDVKCFDCGRSFHYESDQPEYRGWKNRKTKK